MSFIYTRTLQRKPGPSRLYLHETAESLYAEPYRDSTREEIDRIRANYFDIFKNADFMIGFLSGNESKRITELFGYGNIKNWPGNPEVHNWVFENGIYKLGEKENNSEVRVVLQKEDAYRKKTKNLWKYMTTQPRFPGNVFRKERRLKSYPSDHPVLVCPSGTVLSSPPRVHDRPNFKRD